MQVQVQASLPGWVLAASPEAPSQAHGISPLPTSSQKLPQDFKMKHFHAGQIVSIEFSSLLSAVLGRDVLINYSPYGLGDQ